MFESFYLVVFDILNHLEIISNQNSSPIGNYPKDSILASTTPESISWSKSIEWIRKPDQLIWSTIQ